MPGPRTGLENSVSVDTNCPPALPLYVQAGSDSGKTSMLGGQGSELNFKLFFCRIKKN